TGCKLSDYSRITIDASSGGSAVLPCSCADPQATVSNLRWQYRKENVVGGFNDIYPTDETQRFKSRIQLVNAAAPGNFSLHISHLTAEDEGLYQCQDKNQTSNYRLVTLQVKSTVSTPRPGSGIKTTPSTPRPGSGSKTTPSTPRPVTPKPNGDSLSTPEAGSCKLLDYSQITIEGLSGGSAVLPCSCADPQATVSNLRWQYRKKNVVGGFNDIYPTDETQRFKSLIQLVNAAAPGNFSLHISHLTAEDEGLYQC
ncbi:hypothetical protein C0J45_16280, partial [Silurus meridionalis]